MIWPDPLVPGGTVLLIAPSSPLRGADLVEQVAERVKNLGFRVCVGASCCGRTCRGYAAAPAEIRASDLYRGFEDPEIDALWCVRGGSTSWELLPLLAPERIMAHPKPFIGFSDVTALHLFFQQRCGLVTFHGPTAGWLLREEPGGFTSKSLLSCLRGEDVLQLRNPPGEALLPLRPGWAAGELVGGNLSLVAASLGTPGQIDARGRILFLEEVGEPVYRLERMLWQLREAGVLKQAAAVLLGAFTGCQNTCREEYGPGELLRDFFADNPEPVIGNIRSAHCTPMVTLPLGACCEVDGDRGTLTVFRQERRGAG